MKIVHLSAIGQGGAARAALRLHAGLRKLGHDSLFFVKDAAGDEDGTLIFNPGTNLFARALRMVRRKRIESDFAPYRHQRAVGQELFSDDRSALCSEVRSQLPPCDVIHLHWVAGFIDYSDFLSTVPRQTPVVWTLHDMNPFTGGCHYDEGCGKFAAACGACPQLGSADDADLSRRSWKRRHEALSKVPPGRLHIVADSRWLAAQAKSSSLFAGFPVTSIHYSLEVDKFAPRDRLAARSVLGIPGDARVVLFVADHVTIRRKGFAVLVEALRNMPGSSDPFLLSMGHGTLPISVPFPHLHLGHVSGDRFLSIVYSSADVFVIPSLQEAFGQVALESMACGTPVVGSDAGGIPEVVRDGLTGLLARAGDSLSLRDSILRLLNDASLRSSLASNCREIAVKEYALEIQAKNYVDLYSSILGKSIHA